MSGVCCDMDFQTGALGVRGGTGTRALRAATGQCTVKSRSCEPEKIFVIDDDGNIATDQSGAWIYVYRWQLP